MPECSCPKEGYFDTTRIRVKKWEEEKQINEADRVPVEEGSHMGALAGGRDSD